MELRTLKYFVSAFETGSITAAANACHIAQPSISQAIQKLEAELQCTLFVREKTGVTPTEAGNLLYQHATKLLRESDNLVSLFVPTARRIKRQLNLAVHLPLSRFNWVLEVLSQTLPSVQWSIVDDDLAAELHLCTQAQCPAEYQFLPLWQDSYALLVPDSMAIDLTKADIDLWRTLPFIERPFCENRHLWLALQKQLGVQFRVSAQARSEEWAQLMVAKGFGVCLAPTPPERVTGVKVVPLPALADMSAPVRTLGWAIAPTLDFADTLKGVSPVR